jgi:S-adenosylmethionine decarboxylase
VRTLGRQVVAEFYACDPTILHDVDALRCHLLAAAERIGARVLGETFHRFASGGVSGTLVIAESHLSIHTWPEEGYAAVDLFTCGGLDPRRGFESLGVALRAATGRMQEIVRGLPNEIEHAGAILPQDVMVLAHAAELIPFSDALGDARRGPADRTPSIAAPRSHR